MYGETEPQTSPIRPATQPPWMLTPPPSAEKLMRALSIDPSASSVIPPASKDHDNAYFEHLNAITDPSYRDPPIPSTLPAKPKDEPLFLDDDDDDDIQIGTDNRMVLFKSVINAAVKRPHEEDDDIEFTGAVLPPDGIAYLGTPVKRRRRVKQEKEKPAEEEGEEEQEDEASQLAEVDEALREVKPIQRGCAECRCFCNTIGMAPKRSGSGSTTLSPRVMGDLLHMLMGEGHSLLSIISRTHPDIHTWADIAERVGARREDFDRVRHAASGMQQDLPQKKARGEF